MRQRKNPQSFPNAAFRPMTVAVVAQRARASGRVAGWGRREGCDSKVSGPSGNVPSDYRTGAVADKP